MSKVNFYDYITKEPVINPNKDIHHMSVPFRMIIAAPSGSGKSNAVLNLIVHFNQTFHQIILCVKSADEPLYNHLAKKISSVRIFEGGEVPYLEEYCMIDKSTGRIKRNDNLQRLIIFDDLITDKKANNVAIEYYIKARKVGFSCIYIGQSFYQIPKMIRFNSQYFILGRNLLNKDLRMILSAFPSDKTLDEFSDIYTLLTNEPLDTVIIDVEHRTIRPNIIGDAINL